MNDVLHHWLGETLGVVEALEREVAENHLAIQQAMAEIRDREAHIESVERNIGVIRRATSEVDAYAEDARFEEQFDDVFMTPDYRDGSEAGVPPMTYLDDEESDTSNVHIMPVAAASGARRLPPPPPAAARHHR